MTFRRTPLVIALALCAAFSFAGGPADNYYVTDGDQNHNAVINGSTATVTLQATGAEYAIAVDGDIRTSNAFLSGGAGYDLSFGSNGNTYTSSNLLFYDGTTDNSYNYSVSYGNGAVYRTGRDWSSPTFLFFAGAANSELGITYDSLNNSLWVSDWTGTMITDYSMSGAALSTFSTGITRMTSLAYDGADNTLWFGSQGTKGTFYQFSTGGTALQSQFYANMGNENTLGGEFNFTPAPTPEPITIGLGLAGIAIAARRRLKAR